MLPRHEKGKDSADQMSTVKRARYAREQIIHRIASNQLLEVLKIKLNEANTTLPCQDSTVRAALTLALL